MSLDKYSRRNKWEHSSSWVPSGFFSLPLICSIEIKLSNRNLGIKQNFITEIKAIRDEGTGIRDSRTHGHFFVGTSKIKLKFPRHAPSCVCVALRVKYSFLLISIENQPQKPTQALKIMGKLVLYRHKDCQAVLSGHFEKQQQKKSKITPEDHFPATLS